MRRGLVTITIAAFWISPCHARIITVDDNGQADFNNIQAAINDAINGDTIVIQPGIYIGEGNRDIDFLDKTITVSSFDPNDPCYVTATIIDCQADANNRHRGINFIRGEDINSILSGITIIDGYAPDENIFGDFNSYGGAIYCYESSPTIKNCIMTNNSASRGGAVYFGLSAGIIQDCNFTNNNAYYHGGAILCRQSQVLISNSSFQSNTATSYGGAIYSKEGNDVVRECNVFSNQANYGGGIYFNSVSVDANSNLIQNCLISYNAGFQRGGGILVADNLTIKDCVITYNQGFNGGGVNFINSSDPIMTNCIISGNGIIGNGGSGVKVQSGSRARITNCTITNNESGYMGGGFDIFRGSPIVENCIIWGNICVMPSGQQISVADTSSTLTLFYNNIEGGVENILLWFGGRIGLEVGNIDVDPCFADPCNLDFHLQSSAGRWDPNSQIWIQDQNTSLCIDAGNPGCPLGNEPVDINNVRINMGAYGGTAQASKTPDNWYSLADLTNDWQIDLSDVKGFTSNWLMTSDCLYGDLNRDQSVDFCDFAIFGNEYE